MKNKTTLSHNLLKTASIILCALFASVFLVNTQPAQAKIREEIEEEFAGADIWFYDPDDDNCYETAHSGGSISINASDLPQEAIQRLEAGHVKELAEQQYEKYKAAADKAGILWQAVAAIHSREGSMNPNQSVSNGAPLGSGTNVDGYYVGSDAQKDADDGAAHLVQQAKVFYNVELTAESSMEDYGKAFVGYNRGGMYNNAGLSWDESPYAMNFIDDAHVGMHFPNVGCNFHSGEPASTCGKYNDAVGALTVMIYLGAFSGNSESSDGYTAGATSDGSNVTYIGDSISVYSEQKLKEHLPNADYHIQSGKIFSERGEEGYGGAGGLTILREIVNENKLRSTLVYALGANEPDVSQDKIDEVLDLASTAKRIIFVTQYKKDVANSYDNFNNKIRDIESTNNKVVVVDWKAEASKDSDKYISTGDSTYVHPTAEGQALFADLIARAVGTDPTETTSQGSDCGCTTSVSSLNLDGGFTDEQAEKLKERYASREDLNNDLWTVSAGTEVNCVSLSTWFVQLFTDLGGQSPLTGGTKKGCIGCADGGDFVNTLATGYGVKTGKDIKPGAIFSVAKTASENGHTGVVMRINDDGTVLTLNSAYGGDLVYFGTVSQSYFVNVRHSDVFAYLDDHWDTEALGKALGQNIGSTSISQNGSGGAVYSDVKWTDGWITSGMDGYEKYTIDITSDSAWTQDYTTKMPGSDKIGPNKITLHTTEGYYSGEKYTYSSTMYPPHFTVDMVKKRVWQHYSIYGPSNAVKTHDTSAGIQIEIVGYSGAGYEDNKYYMQNTETFGDDEWAYLAKVLAAISSETKIPLTTGVDWENPKRLSAEEYKNYEGIIAHMHVPDNDHTDTGDIWKKLSPALGSSAVEVATDNCDWGWNDAFVWYSQSDSRWGGLSYSQGNMASSGCGPTSLAMITTNLNRIDFTPDKVRDITLSYGTAAKMAYDNGNDAKLKIQVEMGVSPHKDQMSEKLREGYFLWTSGAGSEPFTGGGHYIMIRGITTDGKWLIGDSKGNGHSTTFEKEWEPEEILAGMHSRDGSGGGAWAYAIKSNDPNADPYPTVVDSIESVAEAKNADELKNMGGTVSNSDPGLKELSDSDWGGKYLLYVPEKVDAKAPLIVWLHGIGEWNGNMQALRAAAGPAEEIAKGATYNAYILMPNAPGSGFRGQYKQKTFDLIKKVANDSKYHIDKNRIHLIGFSAGAIDAANMFTIAKDYFATATFVTLLGYESGANAELKKVPIRLYWSDGDVSNTPASVRSQISSVGNSGAGFQEFHYGADVGHAQTMRNAMSSDLIPWLLKQRKK